jgi:hypothetical protein
LRTKSVDTGVTAWPDDVVDAFADGGEDILVVPRPVADDVRAVVAMGRVHQYRASISARTVNRRVKAGLAALAIDYDALAIDIISLARSFLVQFGRQTAHLRIEIVATQSCPKLHRDNVNVRLVTTYFGPTTQYRHAGDDTVHSAPLYGLVFLKGHKKKIDGDLVHHRSPEVPAGTKRLCVVLDY